MRPAFVFAVLAIFTVNVRAQTPLPRIDPAGIPGTLALCNGDAPPETLAPFLKLAGGKNARLVVLRTPGDKGKTNTLRLHEAAELEKAQSFAVLRFGWDDADSHANAVKQIQDATGVWIARGDPTKQHTFLTKTPIGKACRAVLERGGIVAGDARLVASIALDEPKQKTETRRMGWLPESIVGPSEEAVAAAIKDHPGFVGYVLGEGVCFVRGRRIISLCRPQTTIHLAAAKWRPAKRIVLNATNIYADLTALRRSARLRTGPEFPPKKLDPPMVEKGTLVIVGGGGFPKGLMKRFVDLAGGKNASIIVLPTAQPDPLPPRSGMVQIFQKYGAKKVTLLRQRRLEDVESPEFLKIVKEATGIWFGGGRQWRFVDAYENTKAHKLMHDVLRRGGVIGGTSAGASIQAEYMARGDPLGNRDIIAEGYERGLGFIKGVGIDQHFSRRKRFSDMEELMRAYPQLLGIGIDETTAIVVQKNTAEVVGKGRVFFYDHRDDKGKPMYTALPSGRRYDLRLRKELKTKDK